MNTGFQSAEANASTAFPKGLSEPGQSGGEGRETEVARKAGARHSGSPKRQPQCENA